LVANWVGGLRKENLAEEVGLIFFPKKGFSGKEEGTYWDFKPFNWLRISFGWLRKVLGPKFPSQFLLKRGVIGNGV